MEPVPSEVCKGPERGGAKDAACAFSGRTRPHRPRGTGATRSGQSAWGGFGIYQAILLYLLMIYLKKQKAKFSNDNSNS